MNGDRITLPAASRVAAGARTVLESNWRIEGYTVPNGAVYPFQWLWDSCFHAITWAALDMPDRARREVSHLFRTQSELGFVPHVDYETDPKHHAKFWGRKGQSSITQPPMFGHAIAELAWRGVFIDDLVEPATRGLNFLLDERARIDGLVALCHPWESGGDDCPRWDHWCPGGWEADRWYDIKGELVGTVEHAADGSPISNPSFQVASCGFNALVVFNARELAGVTGDDELRRKADALATTLATRWDASLATWVDAGDSAATSGRVRTLDALLPVLVDSNRAALDAAFAQMLDPAAFGGVCGPAGVHRAEPSYEQRTYWRGPAWPQLTYLMWVAACRQNRPKAQEKLATMLIGGATTSHWAEYWDADDGTGLGAAPQSWAALAAVVALDRDDY